MMSQSLVLAKKPHVVIGELNVIFHCIYELLLIQFYC